MSNSRYPFALETLNYYDFNNMFNKNGNDGYTFFNLKTSFMTAKEYYGTYLKQTIYNNKVYDYNNSNPTPTIRLNKPVNTNW